MNARGNGANLQGSGSAFEPADIEQREVEFASACGGEFNTSPITLANLKPWPQGQQASMPNSAMKATLQDTKKV